MNEWGFIGQETFVGIGKSATIYKYLNKDEQLAMLAGLYLGRSSYFYWQENSVKWIDKLAVLGSKTTANAKISDGELIGGADVAGAISGAGSVGLAAWAFGPVGWGFTAAFTAASALVSSGGAAIIVYSSKLVITMERSIKLKLIYVILFLSLIFGIAIGQLFVSYPETKMSTYVWTWVIYTFMCFSSILIIKVKYKNRIS